MRKLKTTEDRAALPARLVLSTPAAMRTSGKRFGAFSKSTDAEVVDGKEL